MNISITPSDFRFTGKEKFSIAKAPNKIAPLYTGKKDYRKLLEEYRSETNELQKMMYAHNRHSMLLVFQAMDAAGKDGTIKHVMSGINPHGMQIFAFKKPSANELDHDFMWRTSKCLPQRGRLGIFNRSYYEEVLVVKVHPEILTKYQSIPKEFTQDVDQVFKERYQDIANFEQYIHRQGTHVMKFFLNLSKEEQKNRFLDRIDRPDKNWKFSEADVKERKCWDQYMEAYEDAINATASEEAPWYVVPADDKKNMRLIVSQLILNEMRKMDMNYPIVTDERRAELQQIRKGLMED